MKLRRDENGVAHIIGLSGGKDSTCLAILLSEREPRPYNYVCTPTGNELPNMLEHWAKLERLLKSPLIMLSNEGLEPLIDRQGCIPNPQKRFCTRLLKLVPYGRFMTEALPAVSYVGLRDDEEEREGAIHGGDFVPKDSKLIQRYPLREWGMCIEDVYAALEERGIEIPDRTDCAFCFYQRLGEWYLLWLNHPDIWAVGEAIEERHGYTFRNPQRDTWPAAMKDLRARFEAGEKPEISLKMMDKRKGMCRACTL